VPHAAPGVVGAGFGQHLLATNPVPTSHKVIGWLVVALATLQISAFLLRPSEVCLPAEGPWMKRKTRAMSCLPMLCSRHAGRARVPQSGSVPLVLVMIVTLHGLQACRHGPSQRWSSCGYEELSHGLRVCTSMQSRTAVPIVHLGLKTGIQPPQGSRLRPLFNVYHRWTGRSAAGLAIANVFIGLHVAGEALKFYWCAAVL